MEDVARRAGVSIATVSRALRDVPGVSAGTRDRVRAIAEELAYVVSPEASRLSRRETGRIAVVVPRIDAWFHATMLAAVESTLRGADLDVLVYQLEDEHQRRRFFDQLPVRRKVDALVLVALPLLPHEESRLDLMGVEVVVAGGRLRDHAHVVGDDELATKLAMDHLLELGHRRIALIRTDDTDRTEWSADVVRTRAFRAALTDRGLPVPADYLVTTPPGPMAGSVGMERLLALADPPTAVFAFSDEIAVAALACLHRTGLAVPATMSLIGVDGHPSAELFGISTVTQSVAVQGRLAAEMALSLLRDHRVADRSVVVPPTLVARASTGPPTVALRS